MLNAMHIEFTCQPVDLSRVRARSFCGIETLFIRSLFVKINAGCTSFYSETTTIDEVGYLRIFATFTDWSFLRILDPPGSSRSLDAAFRLNTIVHDE